MPSAAPHPSGLPSRLRLRPMALPHFRHFPPLMSHAEPVQPAACWLQDRAGGRRGRVGTACGSLPVGPYGRFVPATKALALPFDTLATQDVLGGLQGGLQGGAEQATSSDSRPADLDDYSPTALMAAGGRPGLSVSSPALCCMQHWVALPCMPCPVHKLSICTLLAPCR